MAAITQAQKTPRMLLSSQSHHSKLGKSVSYTCALYSHIIFRRDWRRAGLRQDLSNCTTLALENTPITNEQRQLRYSQCLFRTNAARMLHALSLASTAVNRFQKNPRRGM